MSKTPLQLYINERYNDAVSGYVNKECYHQQKKSRKHQSDTFNGRQPTFKQLLHSYTNSDLCFGSQTIFKNYLREHKKSIEDYYNLQKQQKEILRLCKEKIARKFPAQLVANLADEDVIRALKIAQNSETSQIDKRCSSDLIVDAILQFITSNHEQQKLTRKKKKSEGFYTPVKANSCKTHISPQNTTPNSAFKRFLGVFKKSKAQSSKNQECTYTVQNKKERSSTWSCPQVERRDLSESDSAIESDTSITSNQSKMKVTPIINLPPKPKHINEAPKITAAHQTATTGAKCRCHSKVRKITHDIKRQENQIKEIQSTLRLCLTILKQIEHPHAKFEVADKSNSDVQMPRRIEYHYRAEHVTNKTKKKKGRAKAQKKKSDTSAEEVRRVCCYKCKRKRKTPDKLTAGTSTSQTAVPKTVTSEPPPTTITPLPPLKESGKPSGGTIDQTSLASSLAEDKKKKNTKDQKRGKKRQKQKKRCCLIRLIKFVCCSGCCT